MNMRVFPMVKFRKQSQNLQNKFDLTTKEEEKKLELTDAA
jgi:hypothetical protein